MFGELDNHELFKIHQINFSFGNLNNNTNKLSTFHSGIKYPPLARNCGTPNPYCLVEGLLQTSESSIFDIHPIVALHLNVGIIFASRIKLSFHADGLLEGLPL